MTDIQREILEKTNTLHIAYAEKVVELVRVRYSMNDELAIQRQRDTKIDEFKEYDDFVEECKIQARNEIYGTDE